MKEFILKSLVITACIGILCHFAIPRYERIDRLHRFDRFSGEAQHKSIGKWYNDN